MPRPQVRTRSPWRAANLASHGLSTRRSPGHAPKLASFRAQLCRLSRHEGRRADSWAISPAAIRILESQKALVGNPHFFPATIGDGPFTAVADCLRRVCALAGISGATPHTLRHTFGSIAGEQFSELTIRAMLGHASQNVTQDYVHIDEAVKLAVTRTADEIALHLAIGAAKAGALKLAA